MITPNYNYTPTKGTGLREAIENAIRMARATGKNIIIQINNARFCVDRDTKMQEAIDTYMDVKRKIYETEKQLKQKSK